MAPAFARRRGPSRVDVADDAGAPEGLVHRAHVSAVGCGRDDQPVRPGGDSQPGGVAVRAAVRPRARVGAPRGTRAGERGELRRRSWRACRDRATSSTAAGSTFPARAARPARRPRGRSMLDAIGDGPSRRPARDRGPPAPRAACRSPRQLVGLRPVPARQPRRERRRRLRRGGDPGARLAATDGAQPSRPADGRRAGAGSRSSCRTTSPDCRNAAASSSSSGRCSTRSIPLRVTTVGRLRHTSLDAVA